MPLQIQADESLASYVRRNLHLNWRASNMGIFDKLATRHVLKTIEVKGLAEALGWPGCYGFNRLLQGHTMMAATHVFKGHWDHSYSDQQYVSEGERFSEWEAAFCPECVREDLESLGFSYWRRYGVPHVNVCHKHNVVLQSRCPYCTRPFTRMGHDLDVMWKKCGDRHLASALSEVNEDPAALRRAVVYHRLCTSPQHIPDDGAVRIALRRAGLLLEGLQGEPAVQVQSAYEDLTALTHALESARLKNSAPVVAGINARISAALVRVYERYDGFAHDISSIIGSARPIESLWSSYRAGGVESANFVEERYEHGVGIWSCPQSSPLSAEDQSHDGFYRRRQKIYPCCNLEHPKSKGYKLNPVTVMALPGVPLVRTHRP